MGVVMAGLDLLASQIAAPALVTSKSVNEVLRDFRDTLTRWVVDAANGNKTAGELSRSMRALLRKSAPDAFKEGMREGGVREPDAEMEDDDDATIEDWLTGQMEYVKGFANDAAAVSELTGDARTDARNGMLGRVTEWEGSLRNIGQRGYLSAKGNMPLTLDGDDGEESCKECMKYKGQRHRRSWWEKRGLLDRPNANYGCGRFDTCHHHFYDDDGAVVVN